MDLFKSVAHYLKNTDLYLAVIAFICSGYGMALIYSATLNPVSIKDDGSTKNLYVQGAAILIGFGAFVLMSLIDLEGLRNRWKNFVIVNICLQLLLFTPLGMEVNGQRAWLNLGVTSLQPGELGKLIGEEGNLIVKGPEGAQTDPDEAAEFAERTGVDCLAVSIGTQHGAYVAAPHLNIERLKKIHEVVKVPLVLHGGSGTPVEQVQDSIRNGIRKINVATDVLTTMIKTYTNLSTQEGFKYNTAIYPKVKDAMKEFIKGKMLDFSFRK